MATKKANPAYRKTTRNGIPVYVSTTTGRVVKGPAGVKRSAKKLAGAVKRTVRRAVKVGVKRVKAAIKRNPREITPSVAYRKASEYARQRLIKQDAWEKFLVWARNVSTSYMPTDTAKREAVKVAFMRGWTGMSKNPADKLIKGANLTADQRRQVYAAYVNRHHAIGPGKHYRNDAEWLYDHAFAFNKSGKLSGRRKWAPPHYMANPKAKKVGRTRLAPLNGTAVGKSAYKTTMTAAAKLMPFPAMVKASGRRADGEKVSYYLYVKKNNVAMARKILNGMAKTMTKKATK